MSIREGEDCLDTVMVNIYDLFDLCCDAYVAGLDDAPFPNNFYLDRIKNLAYGYLPSSQKALFEAYLDNKDYLPPTEIIIDTH